MKMEEWLYEDIAALTQTSGLHQHDSNIAADNHYMDVSNNSNGKVGEAELDDAPKAKRFKEDYSSSADRGVDSVGGGGGSGSNSGAIGSSTAISCSAKEQQQPSGGGGAERSAASESSSDLCNGKVDNQLSLEDMQAWLKSETEGPCKKEVKREEPPTPVEAAEPSDVAKKDEDEGEKSSKDTKEDDEDSDEKKKSDKKKKKAALNNSRKNIRDILTQDKLESETLAAQREEMERKRRLQEIQQRAHQEMVAQQILLRQQERRYIASGLLRKPNTPNNVNTTTTYVINSNSTGGKRPIYTLVSTGTPLRTTKTTSADDVIVVDSNSSSSEDERLRNQRKQAHSVIAISSSSEESSSDEDEDEDEEEEEEEGEDDDVVPVSESEEDEAKEQADPNNSGSHTNDAFNQPDAQGRVLVNVGHPADDPDIFLADQLARAVKPHQIGGIRFLYDNIVESLSSCKTSNGFGCILAHSMGLGKTLQVICFVDVFFRHTGNRTVLIIVPINTIQNWISEFNMWLPAAPPPSSSSSSSLSSSSSSGLPVVNSSELVHDSMSTSSGSSNLCNGRVNGMDCEQSQMSENGFQSMANPMEGDIKPPQPQPPLQRPDDGDNPQVRYRKFEVFAMGDGQKTNPARAKLIRNWTTRGGVLLIGYELYRIILSKKSNIVKMKRGRKPANQQEPAVEVDDDKNKELIQEMQQTLQKPDLVICDEGHRIKNCHASTSQALKMIKTKRRVVLTGYPLQNNLIEYWCMVDFVRPNFLGTRAEFCNMFERPIQNGQCSDSTPEDIKLMRYRTHVLHSLLEGFVQRRGHSVLRITLPTKFEHIMFVRMTPIQRQLYNKFMEELQRRSTITNPIKAFAVCCKIWNHPDVLFKCVKSAQGSRMFEEDLDLEEAKMGPNAAPGLKKRGPYGGRMVANVPATLNPMLMDGMTATPTLADKPLSGMVEPDTGFIPASAERHENGTFTYDWAHACLKDYSPGVLENGYKMVLALHIIEQSCLVGDRLLLFSQSLYTLGLIEDFLSQLPVPFSNGVRWAKNKNYFRLDGSTSACERERLVNEFNRNENIVLFLISTRAGSLGINLIGANRVIVFDASWNPCHDTQAVCRVYRYGQSKSCHVYRFVTDVTLEKKIYDRQINKQGMSDRVVDELTPDVTMTMKEVNNLLCIGDKDKEPEDYSQEADTYQDHILRHVCRHLSHCLSRKPFEHESQLMDRKELKLTKTEKRLAKQSYEMDKKATVHCGRSYYGYSRSEPLNHHGTFNHLGRPVANVRPIQSTTPRTSPLDILAKQGVSFRQIQLTKEVRIPAPANGQGEPIVIPAGQQVMIISSPKGIFLRCPNNKVVQIPYPQNSTQNNRTVSNTSITSRNIVARNRFQNNTANSGKEAEIIDLSDDDDDDDSDDEDEEDDDIIVTSSKPSTSSGGGGGNVSATFPQQPSSRVIVSPGSNTYTSQNPALLTGGLVVRAGPRNPPPVSVSSPQQQQQTTSTAAAAYVRPMVSNFLSTVNSYKNNTNVSPLMTPRFNRTMHPMSPVVSHPSTTARLVNSTSAYSSNSTSNVPSTNHLSPLRPNTYPNSIQSHSSSQQQQHQQQQQQHQVTITPMSQPLQTQHQSHHSQPPIQHQQQQPHLQLNNNNNNINNNNNNSSSSSSNPNPDLPVSALEYLNQTLSTPNYNSYPPWGMSGGGLGSAVPGCSASSSSSSSSTWGSSYNMQGQSPAADQVAFVSSIRDLLLPTAPRLFPPASTQHLPELVTAPLSAQHLGALYPHVLDVANDAPSTAYQPHHQLHHPTAGAAGADASGFHPPTHHGHYHN